MKAAPTAAEAVVMALTAAANAFLSLDSWQRTMLPPKRVLKSGLFFNQCALWSLLTKHNQRRLSCVKWAKLIVMKQYRLCAGSRWLH